MAIEAGRADTPKHRLAIMIVRQAQKHITHNHVLHIIDAVVKIVVNDPLPTLPPESPADGDRFIVVCGVADAWSATRERRQLPGWRWLSCSRRPKLESDSRTHRVDLQPLAQTAGTGLWARH